MKKFQFLLLDAGPIIKLFELGLWDDFIGKCNVTICSTVAREAKWASREFEDTCIDLDGYHHNGRIQIIDVELPVVRAFSDKFGLSYKAMLHDGEAETLAFLCNSSEKWLVCTADAAVFKTLGVLGRSLQGISLQEALAQLGLGRDLEWKYTERFRQKYASLGQMDSIQGRGLH